MSKKLFNETVNYLKSKKKVLLLVTSNRWNGHDEVPKSTSLAYQIQDELGKQTVTVLDVSKLRIYECEGNVSSHKGNNCGLKEAKLKGDKDKTGELRCWASFNNPDDELYKVVNELLISDTVIFFGSIRWGKMNSVYTRLIERLTWLENRHTNLGESNILKDIEAGVISVGHNWNGKETIELEKKVLEFFGFKTPKQLYWSYQWTDDANDETKKGYKEDFKDFKKEFEMFIKESVIKFKDYFVK